MKYSFSILILFLSIQCFSAQTEFSSSKDIFERRHEVKLEIVKLMAMPMIETTYEYVHDRNKGYGATLLFNLNRNKRVDYPEYFSFTPFFRMYFDRDQQYGAKGFFVEAFTSLYSGVDQDSFTSKENDYFETSLGFSIGQKWINRGGFVFEVRLGVGRNLLGNSSVDFMLKGGAYVGYRF